MTTNISEHDEQLLEIITTNISEHDEQCNIIKWRKKAVLKYPELWLLHAIPNGGLRNIRVASKLKKEGVLSGVSDLFLPVARLGYHGLYIEMKKIGSSKATDNQQAFIDGVTEQGYCAVVCHGAEEAIKVIELYMYDRK